MIYLTNALGEETGNADIPKEVRDWYDKTYPDSLCLSYLVYSEGKYLVRCLHEIENEDSETWGEFESYAQITKENYLNNLNNLKLPEGIQLDKNIGFMGRHELYCNMEYPCKDTSLVKVLDKTFDKLFI